MIIRSRFEHSDWHDQNMGAENATQAFRAAVVKAGVKCGASIEVVTVRDSYRDRKVYRVTGCQDQAMLERAERWLFAWVDAKVQEFRKACTPAYLTAVSRNASYGAAIQGTYGEGQGVQFVSYPLD